MNKIIDVLFTALKSVIRFFLARKNVALRFVYTLFFAVVLVISAFSILVLTMVQFLILFVSIKEVDSVKSLSHMLTVYTYKVMRYLSLNEKQRPFPFHAIPDELEPPEAVDLTNPMPVPEETMNPDENLAAAEKIEPETAAETEAAAEKESEETIILDYKEGEEEK